MSAFVISARKYRPQRFSEVIGQEQVTKTLQSALKKDRVAQAFLFCGPHGVGKTTCARILAKTLNCTDRTDDFEPCGKCSSCESFENHASFNIIELDAASNNSVDHIRQLTEQVRFAPQQGKYKVFIIDEVHMLSSAAFNAFLKTLEEPPPYAIFILATTEKNKILPTILSRCQIFDFRRISSSGIVEALQDIQQKEGVHADDEALHLIAQKANGAMRDALSLYDKVVSSVGNTIHKKDVVEHLSLLDQDYYFEVVDAMMMEDLPAVLAAFAQIVREGFHPEIFVQGLMEHFRNLLFCKDKKTTDLLDTSQALKDKYLKQSQVVSTSLVLTGLDLLNNCNLELPRVSNKELHVEICLAKVCYALRKIEAPLFTDQVKKKPSEKLTTESSQENAPSAKKKDKTAKKQKTTSTESIPSKATSSEEKAPEQTETSQSIKASEANEVKKQKTRTTSIPKVDSIISMKSLEDMEAEVKQELQRSKSQKALKLPDIQKHWLQYAEDHIEMASTRAVFRKAELELSETTLQVSVANKIQKYSVVSEKNLIKYLRKKLENNLLSLEIIIDSSLAEKKEEKEEALTDREIFEALKESNPLLLTLIDELQLSHERDI